MAIWSYPGYPVVYNKAITNIKRFWAFVEIRKVHYIIATSYVVTYFWINFLQGRGAKLAVFSEPEARNSSWKTGTGEGLMGVPSRTRAVRAHCGGSPRNVSVSSRSASRCWVPRSEVETNSVPVSLDTYSCLPRILERHGNSRNLLNTFKYKELIAVWTLFNFVQVAPVRK